MQIARLMHTAIAFPSITSRRFSKCLTISSATSFSRSSAPARSSRGTSISSGISFTLELRIITFEGIHRIIDEPGDVGLFGLILNVAPPSLWRHPENIFSRVLITTLQQPIGFPSFDTVSFQLLSKLVTPRLERVADVIQENEPQDDMLVFGSVAIAAQLIDSLPECFCIEIEL